MLRSLQRSAALVFLAAIVLPACGAAVGGEAKSVGAPPVPPADLSTPEGAADAVAQAERAIDQTLAPAQAQRSDGGLSQIGLQQGTGAPPPQASSAPMAESAPPPPPPPLRPSSDDTRMAKGAPRPTVAPGNGSGASKQKDEESYRAPGVPADSCSTACSALASMERAADRLCGLTGASDARCTDARTRVKNAGTRVRNACPACS